MRGFRALLTSLAGFSAIAIFSSRKRGARCAATFIGPTGAILSHPWQERFYPHLDAFLVAANALLAFSYLNILLQIIQTALHLLKH